MWIKLTQRKFLLEILAGNGKGKIQGVELSHTLPTDMINKDDLYLVWDSHPNEFKKIPLVIIVSDGQLKDFLAWVSTYLPNYRPFTAYFRVLELETAIRLKGKMDSPSMVGLETASIGLILGEALTLSPELSKRSSLPTIACASTISYCLARAMAVDLNIKEVDNISDKWVLARKLTEQPERNLDISFAKRIWKIIFTLKGAYFKNQDDGPSNLLTDACFQIKRDGLVSNDLWVFLTGDIDDLRDAQKEMTGPREDRVVYFQKILSKETFLKLNNKTLQAFICGYLASLIGPGSMSHLDLITPKISLLRDIVLWYGLCAGLHKNSELLSSFNVLGRRLLRELLKPESILNRPNTDISITELQIFLEGHNRISVFRTFSSHNIVVELAPYISTYLTWPKREPTIQQKLFSDQYLAFRVRSLVENALEIQKIVSGSKELSEDKSKYKKPYGGRKKRTSDY